MGTINEAVETRPGSLLLLALVFIAVVVGCTGPEPVTTTLPTSTTSTTEPAPTFIEASSTLTLVADNDTLAPVELVNAGDRLFLFAEDRGARQVHVWSSEDGAAWTDLGSPFPVGARFEAATTSEGRVIAVTAGPNAGNPSLWSSTDGVNWEVEEVAIDNDNELMQFTVEAVVVNGPITLLTGYQQLAAEDLLEAKIQDLVWPGFDKTQHGLNVQPLVDEIEIDIFAPLGLKLISTTATELGLSVAEQDWIREGNQSLAFETWLGLSDGTWVPSFVEGANLVSSLTAADGAIFAVGHTESGSPGLWTTEDGSLWDQLSTDLSMDHIDVWMSRFVATSETRDPDLWFSDDGQSWESAGIAGGLGGGNWFTYTFEASDTGITATFGAFDSGASQGSGNLELPQINKDGVRVLVQEYGMIRMYEGANEDVEYLWSSNVDYGPDQLDFDTESGVVHFFRDDGSELVSLTLDDLDNLSALFFAGSNTVGSFKQKLVFSSDVETWLVWDLDDLGVEIEPWLVSSIGSRLVIVGRDRSAQSGFGIWATAVG